ncbi:hypothetical protein ONE63_002743 [Megalurothrips usitatus]|uniref:Uncharacterized protein n=1 Tax=Megalurothrips usitatus TaxID=439358 RepID=A0AAV7XBQ9_9NEOP|nr:hypothetical protein ONE63_002743 [Megalurothrips usitatus]
MVLVKAAARRGESVLVHDGASAVGQATIRVATHLGCSPIFASAKDAEQRELLLKTFPQAGAAAGTLPGSFLLFTKLSPG